MLAGPKQENSQAAECPGPCRLLPLRKSPDPHKSSAAELSRLSMMRACFRQVVFEAQLGAFVSTAY